MSIFTAWNNEVLYQGACLEQHWMILDGALIERLEPELIRLFCLQDAKLQHFNLFSCSRWHELHEIAPVLISYSPDIERWAQQQSAWRFGLSFKSKEDLGTLINHWQNLMACEHQGLEGALARLFDPVVFKHLLDSTTLERQQAWLGPIEELWLPDVVHEHYWHCIPQQLKVDQECSNTGSIFTDQEWQGLSDAARFYTELRLLAHMEKFYPHSLPAGRVAKHQWVSEHLQELIELGANDERSAIRYLNVIGRLGNRWDESSRHPEIAQLLKRGAGPLSVRLAEADFLSRQYAH